MRFTIPREGRGGRADQEAKIWLAEQARACQQSHPQISVLFAGTLQHDYAALERILKEPDFRLLRSRSVRRMSRMLRKVKVGVVIAECGLDGRCWKEVWGELQRVENRPLPRLIVAAECRDDCFWDEVVQLGAYDVLAKPFDAGEVVSVVTDAWDQWRRETEAAGPGLLRRAAHGGA